MRFEPLSFDARVKLSTTELANWLSIKEPLKSIKTVTESKLKTVKHPATNARI